MTAEPIKKAAFEVRHEGKAVSLGHLEPSDLVCATDARPDGLRILVIYSCHCFTETYDEKQHGDRQIVKDDRGRERAFCPMRYALSAELPALVAGLPGAHVYQTPEANYVRIKLEGGADYRMFFNLRRATKDNEEAGYDLRLFVESAYRPEAGALEPAKMQKVRFRVLADKVAKGEKVKFHRR